MLEYTMFHPAAAAQDGTMTIALAVAAGLVVAGVIVFLMLRRRGPRDDDAAGAGEGAGEPAGASLREGLLKTRQEGFVARLTGIFSKSLDVELETRIEEVLLTSDIGVRTAQKLMDSLRAELSREQLSDPEAVLSFLKQAVADILTRSDEENAAPAPEGPRVVLVVGVNGVGKTTTIGKLAARYRGEGKRVLMVAGDTFRAAAVDQLKIWAERTGSEFHFGADNADPSSVVFDGVRQGGEAEYDVILVDTAGRLHTKTNLVEELKKIHRVTGKAMAGAPHEVLLVLDATNGQNALQQADIFGGEVAVTGIALTKLDGTAKGGVIIGICDTFGIPVQYVGLGEKAEDLRPFNAEDFVSLLFEPLHK